MKSLLRILNLEDDPNDTDLLRAMLERDGLAAELVRVDTQQEFVAALEQGGFDLIISDYSLPSFDGLAALALARAMRPALPIILFSATIGEEAAIDCLRGGATDYILKQRPERLTAEIGRAHV